MTKRKVPQSCDGCGREINPGEHGWECPYCGYDNRAGVEYAKHAQRVAVERSKAKAKARREGRA